jgi:hypothetical protein
MHANRIFPMNTFVASPIADSGRVGLKAFVHSFLFLIGDEAQPKKTVHAERSLR